MQPTLLINQAQTMPAGGDGFFHGYASVRRALRPAFRQPPSRQVTAKTVYLNCGRKDQQLPIGSRSEEPMPAGGDGFFHGYASVRRALRPAFRQPPSRQVTAKTVYLNCGRKDQQLPIGSRSEEPMSAGGDGFFHGYAVVQRPLRPAFRF
jgi:hypothetical protein